MRKLLREILEPFIVMLKEFGEPREGQFRGDRGSRTEKVKSILDVQGSIALIGSDRNSLEHLVSEILFESDQLKGVVGERKKGAVVCRSISGWLPTLPSTEISDADDIPLVFDDPELDGHQQIVIKDGHVNGDGYSAAVSQLCKHLISDDYNKPPMGMFIVITEAQYLSPEALRDINEAIGTLKEYVFILSGSELLAERLDNVPSLKNITVTYVGQSNAKGVVESIGSYGFEGVSASIIGRQDKWEYCLVLRGEKPLYSGIEYLSKYH